MQQKGHTIADRLQSCYIVLQLTMNHKLDGTMYNNIKK